MRTFLRRTTILVACLGTTIVWFGCSAKQATEYVTGISTQVEVPRDLKAIRVDATVGGVSQWCEVYKVFDGKVRLPGSLGSYANNQSAVQGGAITYTITGIASQDESLQVFADCLTQTKVGEDSVRVLRRSTQPYIQDKILFLPMPLKYSCFDKACADNETCKGGRCVAATLNEDQTKALQPYTPDLVDGSGGGCFKVDLCMGAEQPALAVDPDNCVYAVAASASAPPPLDPNADPFHPPCTTPDQCLSSHTCTNGHCEALPPNTPWSGINVEVIYDGGLTREILDLDPDEGFVYANDPANPQRFKLAPGLCDMVKGGDPNPAGKVDGDTCADGNECKSGLCRKVSTPTSDDPAKLSSICLPRHRITGIRASGTCQPKRISQPFCSEDALQRMGFDKNGNPGDINAPDNCTTVELKPPRSALMLVVDDTLKHKAFFDANEISAVSFPLSDPAFERTDIGLLYAPAVPDNCSTSAAPTIDLAPARTVSKSIVDSLTQLAANASTLPNVPPTLEGALASSYTKLQALDAVTYYKRAVIVVGNSDFDKESCAGITGTPSKLALAARTTPPDPTKPINTYAIQLVKSDEAASLDTDVVDPGLGALVAAGSTDPYNPDARGKASKNAKDTFQKVINSLATCTYDVPVAGAPTAKDVVSFNDPVYGVTTKVPPNAGCTSEGVPGVGWGYAATGPDPKTKRIYLCNDSCTTYRNTLAQASDFALLYKQPAPPVPIFAHRAECEPTDKKP